MESPCSRVAAPSSQRLPSALHLSRELLASMAARGATGEEHDASPSASPAARRPHETRVHLRRTGSVDLFAGTGSTIELSDGALGPPPTLYEATFRPSTAAHDAGAAASPGRVRLTSELPPHQQETWTPPGLSTTQAAAANAAAASSSSASVTASSKAVLGALRALQEKIQRVEGERARATAEVSALRAQLAEAGHETEMRRREEAMSHEEELQELRLTCGRMLEERGMLEKKLAESELRRGELATEAQRIRGRLAAESAARREAEARVGEVAARIEKLEGALRSRNREQEERAVMRALELDKELRQEQAARAELEARHEKVGEVLLSVMDMHQHLLQHYHPPAASPAAVGALRSAALRRGQQHKGAAIAPFLPAPHRRTYNLLATLSQAVRECRRTQRPSPRHVLDALYDIALRETALVGASPRGQRSTFFSSATASAEAAEAERKAAEAERKAACSKAHNGSAAARMGTAQLQENIQQLEEELTELQGRYDALLEEARRGLTPAAAAVRFRDEDLRALVDAIHRREAQVEKLKRRLRKREQGRGQKAEAEGGEREKVMALGGRLSLLSEIRGVSGLSLCDQTRR